MIKMIKMVMTMVVMMIITMKINMIKMIKMVVTMSKKKPGSGSGQSTKNKTIHDRYCGIVCLKQISVLENSHADNCIGDERFLVLFVKTKIFLW